MGFWNYRVLVGKGYAEIIECHYDAAGDLWGYSKAAPVGDDLADLRDELNAMRAALKKPIIQEKDLPKTITGQVPKRPRIKH